MSGSLAVEVPAAEYKLFVREGAPRFYFQNTDEGVYLSPKGIGWFIGGTSYTRDWHEIAGVSLVASYVPKSGPLGTCRIVFRDGYVLSIFSASAFGHSDEERNVEYGRFLTDFHRVIPAPERNAIEFRSGIGKGQHVAMIIVMVIAFLFFFVLPLGLAIYFGEFQALLIAGAGFAGFVYPLYRVTEAGTPATYSPDQVPPELYP